MDISERILTELAGGNTAMAKGPGTNKILVGSNPAAGLEVPMTDFVVPAGKVWVPLSFSVVLAQGITQTPSPALLWDDGTNVLGAAPGAIAAQSASVTSRYTWVREMIPGPTAGAGLTTNIAPLPKLWLPAGYRLGTLTAGIGANSDYAAAVLRYLELTAL